MINRELISRYLKNDSPKQLLEERSTPIDWDTVFSSQEHLLRSLLKTFGEKAFMSFIMDNGIVLQNGSLARAGVGKFGLRFIEGSTELGIDTFRLKATAIF